MRDGAVEARLSVAVAVFAFDPDTATPAKRAIVVLRGPAGLPAGEVGPRESFPEAALRVVTEAGLRLPGKRSEQVGRFDLIGIRDTPGRRRTVGVWYSVRVPLLELTDSGAWVPWRRSASAVPAHAELLREALHRLQLETRHLAGASRLLDDVFTADDLLRLHAAIHGGPEGSERTFRRRIQELRDAGVLLNVRPTEVGQIRARVARFRSPAGTGGRPPELLRYSGRGGDSEPLTGLRARRAA